MFFNDDESKQLIERLSRNDFKVRDSLDWLYLIAEKEHGDGHVSILHISIQPGGWWSIHVHKPRDANNKNCKSAKEALDELVNKRFGAVTWGQILGILPE